MIRPDASQSGRYRLVSRIAVGGMGDVWRGTDVVLDRPVAIKLLHQANDEQNADAVARFRAEARYVGSLSHSGIAQVYDYGEADRDHPPFLVMELVDGPSLAGLLSQGPLDPARAMDFVAQAADALHEAHMAGLVHRDIKPGNLLIGPGDQVKIIDFGIAQAASSVAVTSTGAVIGSPAYLAPERITSGAATPASDLYSLGIVAYECLAGAPPFSGTGMAIAHAHVHQPLPPLPLDIPAKVVPFVEQLTAKDPAARTASAAEVAAHARHLRDSLRGNQTMVLPVMHPGWKPYDSPDARDYADGSERHQPLDDNPPVSDLSRPGRVPRARAPRRLGLVASMVAAALAVLAGLVGWQLKSALDAERGHQAGNAPVTRTPSSHPAADTVMVTASTLDGQNVRDVRRQLRQLGLQPKLNWQQTDQQDPGTVISVTPSGPVQPGSVIVVTVAASQGGDNGNGNGDGGGHGGGNYYGGGGGGHARYPGNSWHAHFSGHSGHS